MEENNIEFTNKETVVGSNKNNGPQQIAGAIILAGIIIAGAVLLKSNGTPSTPNGANNGAPVISKISPVNPSDRVQGNPQAKVTLVLYEDFQCPFCGAVSGLEPNSLVIQSLKQRDPSWSPFMLGLKDYITNGSVQFVYRDWAFLGAESTQSAEAARCAGDQGKFWEFHDYLYVHQNGENKGAFSDVHLKAFAKTLGLDTTAFGQCLDSNKYAQAVADSKTEGMVDGITGTPKGFILVKGKIVSTIDGAESWTTVKPKIDAALK
ncbi:thioredoxin domain-containing protein [Candidatus Nomurabacteria bacterium]|nr:thioredoxin domain-containing protein [Candidatus Nomurabacteria bacterium]